MSAATPTPSGGPHREVGVSPTSSTRSGLSDEGDWVLLRDALRTYWKPVAAGASCLMLIGLVETIPPLLLREVVDRTQKATETRSTWVGVAWIALAYLGGSCIEAVCRYGWRMLLVRASMRAGRDLRERFASKLFSLSASFFDRKRIGDLMSLATSDTEAVRMALGAGMITLVDACFYLITIPVAMFWLSPELAWIALAPLPLVPLFVLYNERQVHRRFKAMQDQQSRLSAIAQEALGGVRVTKAFAFEDEQIARFEAEGKHAQALALNLARAQAGFVPVLDFFASLGLVFMLVFGGPKVLAGTLTIGTFVAFQRYVNRIIWPLTAIGFAANFFQRARASSGRLLEVFRTPSDVLDPVLPIRPEGAPVSPSGAWKTSGRIEFRKLSFRFPGSESWVLRDLNLSIAPGERLALIGAIGSGKTALLSLLPRLYPVERGQVSVDGVDLNDWSIEALRRQVAYVGQDLFLFSESVRENLLFGVERDREGLLEATQMAAVHEEIESLSEGYQTPLGERGVNLSGGQKQRMTIARALACQPSILILDDALSSVDVHTEEKILTALRARSHRNTELIAAHRISTVKDADRILVLDQGRAVQLGSHTELLRSRSGNYARFYERQRLWEDLESYAEAAGGHAHE